MPDRSLAGYWPSPWPAEDGGPTRHQAPASPFSLAGARWSATARECFGANMAVLREPGEVFLQGNTFGPDTTAWVERIDPITLEPVVRSPDLAGGPFWAGGIGVHRNGYLYVTYGRFCHQLDPVDLGPIRSVALPRERPYNSFVILPDGTLVMKDFTGTTPMHSPGAGASTQLVALHPDDLSTIATLDLPEGSIARLSAVPDDDGDGATVVVVGDEHLHAVHWDGAAFAPTGSPRRYVTMEGQSFGWDPVIVDGSAWFLDDGDGTTAFGPSFRGKGTNTAPLHLVRVDLRNPDAEPVLTEVCGRPGGLIANPPAIDPDRRIAVGYDSGNGVVAAFRFDDDASVAPAPMWSRDQDHAGHLLLDRANGLLLTGDFDHERGIDRAVVVDLESGATVASVDTGSPVQPVVFPAPGWHDDLLVISFTTVARLHRR